jgi:hypothetical protein
MFLRFGLAAVVALLLGGCTGWVAETQLIPVAERDPIGLTGTFVSDENRVTFSQGEDGYLLVSDPESSDAPIKVAFDLLREEAPVTSAYLAEEVEEGSEADSAPPDRTFLMEVRRENDEGHPEYIYDIVTIGGSDDGASGSFTRFTVLCSKAAQAFAQKVDGEVCIFDDYARLRAAAFDALAWYDDARMAVAATTFSLEDLDEPEATPSSEP